LHNFLLFRFVSGVKRTSRTALSSLIKPASELTSPPEPPKRKISETETPKRKHSDAAAPKPVDEVSEDTPIAKKRSRRNNASVDNSETEQTRVPSLDQNRCQSPERKRHTSSGQVRSLYDGLSHLYTDCDSRLIVILVALVSSLIDFLLMYF
jgi:hypothetical protein